MRFRSSTSVWRVARSMRRTTGPAGASSSGSRSDRGAADLAGDDLSRLLLDLVGLADGRSRWAPAAGIVGVRFEWEPSSLAARAAVVPLLCCPVHCAPPGMIVRGRNVAPSLCARDPGATTARPEFDGRWSPLGR